MMPGRSSASEKLSGASPVCTPVLPGFSFSMDQIQKSDVNSSLGTWENVMPVEFWASLATVSVFVIIFGALMWRCKDDRIDGLPR